MNRLSDEPIFVGEANLDSWQALSHLCTVLHRLNPDIYGTAVFNLPKSTKWINSSWWSNCCHQWQSLLYWPGGACLSEHLCQNGKGDREWIRWFSFLIHSSSPFWHKCSDRQAPPGQYNNDCHWWQQLDHQLLFTLYFWVGSRLQNHRCLDWNSARLCTSDCIPEVGGCLN